jgi:hypothetical protein
MSPGPHSTTPNVAHAGIHVVYEVYPVQDRVPVQYGRRLTKKLRHFGFYGKQGNCANQATTHPEPNQETTEKQSNAQEIDQREETLHTIDAWPHKLAPSPEQV